MKITKIEQSKTFSNFVNIYIDNNYCCNISHSKLLELGLTKNLSIGESEYKKLQEASLYSVLERKVIKFIHQRPHSKQEVNQYLNKTAYKFLKEKGFYDVDQGTVINQLIKALEENNYIDDIQFTSWFISQRMNSHRPKGEYYIKQELKQKGVSLDIIESAFQNINHKKELENLDKLARKKYKEISKREPNKYKQKQKLFSYIKTKGFKQEDIFAVIDSIFKEI